MRRQSSADPGPGGGMSEFVSKRRAACVARPSPAFGEMPARLWLPFTVGVGQADTVSTAVDNVEFGRPLSRRDRSGPRCPSIAPAVGHAEDEEPFALMARADFRRREKSDLALETESAQVTPNALRAAAREHAADVLDEDPPRAGGDDDAAGGAPQVAWIVSPEASAGDRMRLARDAANDAVHEATEASSREGSHIRPHRSRSHEARFHCCDQSCDGRGFPLHQHDCSSIRHCQLDAEIEPASSGA